MPINHKLRKTFKKIVIFLSKGHRSIKCHFAQTEARFKLQQVKLKRFEKMRRTINPYFKSFSVASTSQEPSSASAQSVDALVRASYELRVSIKTAECTEQRMRLHTQLDKLERQLLKQLANYTGVKPS